MDESPNLSRPALRLDLAGPGFTLDPAAGTVGIASDRLRDGLELTLTTVGSDARPTGSFRVTIRSVPLVPRSLTAPVLVGDGTIGAPLTVDPGTWADADALRLQWCRDGAAIEGATGASYTPAAADDEAALTCRVTASNAAGEATAETTAVAVRYPAPVAAEIADRELFLDGDGSVPAAAAFTGAGLSFAVSGAGATINAVSGAVSLPTSALLAPTDVTVTATNSGGSASVGFKVSVKAVPPTLATAPKLTGVARIGAAVGVDAGVWNGRPAPVTAFQWRRGAADIAGATGASYTPVAADDRTALTCRVTATNAGGSLSATTAALQVSYPAPVASGTLPDLDLDYGDPAGSVPAAAAFTGAGLSFAVSGAGATINAASGAVSLPTSALLAPTDVTVTATNSGGSASVGFKVSVKAVPPTLATAPKLTGVARIGAAVGVDAGVWNGRPAPVTAFQWRRGAADIAGATGASYTPVAADDRTALTCRVTATNAGGSLSATTAAVQVSYPAPVASGALPDQTLTLGAAAGSVAAAAAFTGAGLSFAVSGAGATIDAASGAVSLPASALLAATTVTVTATNSGGSASVGFNVSVEGAFDQIAALGEPSTDFKAVAVSAPLVQGGINSSTDAPMMFGTYSANSLLALGMACLKGDAGSAESRAVEQIRYFINEPSRNPLCSGAFPDNTATLCLALCAMAKKAPATWALFTPAEKTRIDLFAKVCAFDGAFVGSDTNPWYTTGGGKPRTLRGWPAVGGSSLKTTGFNLCGMAPAMMLMSMAYLGGPAAWRTFLQTTTPSDMRAALAAAGLSGGQLYKTMNWRSEGFTGPVSHGGDSSTNAPTDAQIISAVNNPLWFGLPITSYHRILAMMTCLKPAGQKNLPWVAVGNYGSGFPNAGPNNGAAILIGKGWGGDGLDSTGAPVVSGAVQGVQKNGSANPPGMGLVGAPLELYAAQDAEGKRSSMHYTIEGMRPLVAAWLVLWIYGQLDLADPDIVTALPIMDRGVRDVAHKDDVGFQEWAHGDTDGFWPKANLDWQRHTGGGDLDGAQGGNLFALWTEVLGPALGCGNVIRNGGFADASRWAGLGADGKSVSGGAAVYRNTPASRPITQSVPLVPGKYYQVQVTIAGYAGGSLQAYFSGGTLRTGAARSANGTYRERLLVNAGNDVFGLQGVAGPVSLTLDDVSVTGPFETAAVDGN